MNDTNREKYKDLQELRYNREGEGRVATKPIQK